MILSEFKTKLLTLEKIEFQFENGEKIPAHFHITEIGSISKNFIDCGGKIRNEEWANFQLWYSDDTNHRLKPTKLKNIIQLAENKLGLKDLDIEVEYQNETIGKYSLDFENNIFILKVKHTDCLAKENCGIPESKVTVEQSCTPNGKCC